MIQYKIKPRLIKRWFRKPKLIFELIEIETIFFKVPPTYVNQLLEQEEGSIVEETVIFTSENLEEVKNIKNSLENIN
jgi:hypothetical protein